MTILCGTDFTEPAAVAASGAAAIASRLREDLLLVHAAENSGAEAASRRPLELEVARLQTSGVAVRSEVLAGASDEALVARAATLAPRLIVIGALGRRTGPLWRLGSTADRVAQTATVPVLVLRDTRPFEEWSRGARELRIVVGVDSTTTSDQAVRWTQAFESAGPCRVTCAHVYWPPEARERLRAESAMPIGKGNPRVEREMEKELRDRLAALRGARPFELRLLGGLGRTADHLLQIATEEKADLVVVGARQEKGWTRLWHGSVSHGVIDLATTNVASVPSSA